MASNLIAADGYGVADVIVHDRLTQTATRESTGPGGAESNGARSDPSLSSDGRFVTFTNPADGLVANGTNAVDDEFVHDCGSASALRVSVSTSGAEACGASGAIALPWATRSTGSPCVQPPAQRTSFLTSGGIPAVCNGTQSLNVLASWTANPAALGLPLTLGERFEAQAWFRDPPAPKTTNLSNAVRFWIAP